MLIKVCFFCLFSLFNFFAEVSNPFADNSDSNESNPFDLYSSGESLYKPEPSEEDDDTNMSAGVYFILLCQPSTEILNKPCSIFSGCPMPVMGKLRNRVKKQTPLKIESIHVSQRLLGLVLYPPLFVSVTAYWSPYITMVIL